MQHYHSMNHLHIIAITGVAVTCGIWLKVCLAQGNLHEHDQLGHLFQMQFLCSSSSFSLSLPSFPWGSAVCSPSLPNSTRCSHYSLATGLRAWARDVENGKKSVAQ